MSKNLNEMGNEELWQLFPIIIEEYNEDWPRLYEEEIEQLGTVLDGDLLRASHIGSTAVPGLAAKPTIDILLEIDPDTDLVGLVRAMEREGYIYSAQPENPQPHMMFLKGYTPDGFRGQAYHAHIRYPGQWNEVYFRDHLREHPEKAAEYAALKHRLAEAYRNDRDAYTAAKGGFIQQATQEARPQCGGCARKCGGCGCKQCGGGRQDGNDQAD